MPTLGQSIILASGFTHPFICCAIDITVLIQSASLYGDKTVTFGCKYWLLRMRLAISCDPLVQFDDSIEFQPNFNLQVSLV